jgi:hypothetical protein
VVEQQYKLAFLFRPVASGYIVQIDYAAAGVHLVRAAVAQRPRFCSSVAGAPHVRASSDEVRGGLRFVVRLRASRCARQGDGHR